MSTRHPQRRSSAIGVGDDEIVFIIEWLKSYET
jgi:hypothetical protein